MKYPLNSENNINGPKPYRCSGCGKETGLAFLTINGGALEFDQSLKTSLPFENGRSFLEITSHIEGVNPISIIIRRK